MLRYALVIVVTTADQAKAAERSWSTSFAKATRRLAVFPPCSKCSNMFTFTLYSSMLRYALVVMVAAIGRDF
jgi:hypothetical protein